MWKLPKVYKFGHQHQNLTFIFENSCTQTLMYEPNQIYKHLQNISRKIQTFFIALLLSCARKSGDLAHHSLHLVTLFLNFTFHFWIVLFFDQLFNAWCCVLRTRIKSCSECFSLFNSLKKERKFVKFWPKRALILSQYLGLTHQILAEIWPLFPQPLPQVNGGISQNVWIEKWQKIGLDST